MDVSGKVLAISSGGGHWVQLRRVTSAFEGFELVYVTVNETYRTDVPGSRVRIVRDATRWDRFGRPEELPKYGNSAFPTIWWWDAERAAKTGSRR